MKQKLSDICIGGGSYGIAASAVEYSPDLPTYLRITDINDDGTLNFTGLKSVDDPNSANYYLSPNDIVFARTGASTGRNYFYDGTDGEFVYAGFLIKFSVDPEKVNPKFVKYYCQSKEYYDWIASFNTGSTRGNINAQTLGNMPIPDLPREQQDILVTTLSCLDDKIAINKAVNHHLEQLAQALFKSWFVDFEPWGGNMPGDWREGMLGDYCSIKSGFAFKSTWWQEQGVKVIKIKNITDNGFDFSDCSFVSNDKVSYAKEFVAIAGDLLIAMTGATIGKFAIVPKHNEILLVNQRVGKFFLGANPLDKLPFLWCLLKQDEIHNEIVNRGQGSAQPNISPTDIMTISVIIPSDEVLADFNCNLRACFETMTTNAMENQSLATLRDTLLPRLMSGELSVSDIGFGK